MRPFCLFSALCTVSLATAQGPGATPSVDISLGLRETGTTNPNPVIGENGGSSGAIEWVNLDGQQLTLDGSWQTLSWDLSSDAITAFTGNGTLDGAYGVLEHLRIRNGSGVTDGITISMDDLTIVETPSAGGPATATVLQNGFEGFGLGEELLFQEPTLSGSTSGNLMSPGRDIAGVDTTDGDPWNGSAIYRLVMQFVDGDPSKWCRLTTFAGPTVPTFNPLIPFGDASTTVTVSVALRGKLCAPSVTADPACPGEANFLGPLTASFSGTPAIGTTFTMTGGLGGGTSVLVAGLPMAPVVIPGPFFYEPELCTTPGIVLAFSGVGSVPVAIPLDAGQCGFELRVQWVHIESFGGTIGTSDAFDIVVGL